MNDIEKQFKYLELNNIENDFIISLRENYQKFNSLSFKQQESLNEIVLNHENTLYLLSSVEIENEFIKSLKKQFAEKHSLSPKQVDILETLVERQKDIADIFDRIGETDNKFVLSLQSQFEDRGSLTDNQYNKLKQMA